MEVENPESGQEPAELWEPYDFNKLSEPLFAEDRKFTGLTNIFADIKNLVLPTLQMN